MHMTKNRDTQKHRNSLVRMNFHGVFPRKEIHKHVDFKNEIIKRNF